MAFYLDHLNAWKSGSDSQLVPNVPNRLIKQNIRNFHKFLECPLHLLPFLLKWFSFKTETFRSPLSFYKKQ